MMLPNITLSLDTCQANHELKTNPRLVHSYIDHRNFGKLCITPIKMTNGLLTDDPTLMVVCFSGQVPSVCVSNFPSNCFLHQKYETIIDGLIVSPERVDYAIKCLNANSSMGDN